LLFSFGARFHLINHLDFLAIGAELGKVFCVVLWSDGTGTLEHLAKEILASLHAESKSSAGCGWGCSASHLDWNDTTEGTSSGGILAFDKADIVLASDGASASLVSWDGGGHGEISLSTSLSNISYEFGRLEVEQLLTRFREFCPGGVCVTVISSQF
jgi:hypothetical protein